MKKLLFILSAILITSSAVMGTTACQNSNPSKKKDLKLALTKRDLGVIEEENPGTMPTIPELKKALFINNHNLDVNKIHFEHENDNSVEVVGDGIFYTHDTIVVKFQEQTVNIATVINDKFYLGKINTTNVKPEPEIVKAHIHEKLPAVKVEHIIIEVISNHEALVKGDDKFYNGQVTVTFTTDNSVVLSSIIKQDQPLKVKTKGKDVASVDDVIVGLISTYKDKLNTKVIAVKVNGTSANISSIDQKIYTGEVTVTLQLDESILLKDIINKGLDKVAIIDNKITDIDVMNALKKQYPTLKTNDIKVTLENNDATVSSTNPLVYTGDSVVINNLVIDLSSVLNNNLPTFKISGEDKPTNKEIIDALIKTNPNLNIDKVNISDITNSSVNVKGDGLFYSNDVINVTYKIDKTVALSTVFTNLDLGTININGALRPSVEAVTKAISSANPKVDIKAIIFGDKDIANIKDNEWTVIVTADNIIYSGSVTAKFTVDNKTINVNDFKLSHSQTNSAGELKTSWTSDDITLLTNWTNYASDWDSFSAKFSTLTFGDKSIFRVDCNEYTHKKLEGSQLSLKSSEISIDRNIKVFSLKYYHDEIGWPKFGCYIQLDGYIHIWHDNNNVYVSCDWSIDSMWCGRDRTFSIDLKGATFS